MLHPSQTEKGVKSAEVEVTKDGSTEGNVASVLLIEEGGYNLGGLVILSLFGMMMCM